MSENYRSREDRRRVKKKKQPAAKKQKPKGKTSFFRKFLISCLLLGIVGLVAGVATFFVMIKDAPKLEKTKLVNPLSSKIYDKDGKLIYEYGKEKRTNIMYGQIPKLVENAFLATEDARFYEHSGVDFKGTARAVLVSLKGDYGSQGGSTITQQVIKNYFLSMEKTSKRKAQEIYLAYKLEQQYSKHEILEMYLNKVYLGNRSYGIATAVQNYYGKELKDLTLPEVAMLAGLMKAPNNYDPTKEQNIQKATERRNVVLKLMNRHGYITKKEMEEASKVPVTEGLKKATEQKEMPYPAFMDAVVKEVEKELPDANIGSEGLEIYTTLDQKAQDFADKLLNKDIINYPNEKFQGAFTFMDTKTGEVRAIGSGRGENKAVFKGHNIAIELNRSAGSTMKPIFDYAPAIEYLKWATYHQIDDSPFKYSTGQEVRNADRKHLGPITMRDALKTSRNIPAIKTAKEVGINKSKSFSEKLGITFNVAPTESTAIGTNEASPIEIAGAYAAFGNEGKYTKPYFVKKVVYPDGKSKSFEQKTKRVMKDSTAYMITDMLRTFISSGLGTTANIGYLDIAGKTGTTNYSLEQIAQYNLPESATRDSWFAGYTPQYTMAVWTGYTKDSKDDYISSKNTKIAQLIFKEMMSKFATDKSRFKMPNSVVQEGSELRIKGEKRDSSPNTIIANTTEQPSENKQKEKQKKPEELKKPEEQKQSELTNGSDRGNKTPVTNGSDRGNTVPPTNGSDRGNTAPATNGSDRGNKTPATNGSDRGNTVPPTNGSDRGNTVPPTNGSDRGNKTPATNGSDQGNKTPPTNGDGHGTLTPPSNDRNTEETPANNG
ncbi:PBP1A family penicillin-binding protein [Bacillus thuringiensis]|uniref:transglycosylase domain-containing protein n=1 Tax=Bacillus cereus group TaxID=86661 RepID=UPI001298D524|nr:PBP1A family penicillin-binding protein [Bacillus thuringiensis]MEB8859372.1 PBP1A family penicillin-binding protein [Bacillus cereus]MDR5044972.1 PBP1A family penicillin-binding protein [Bacillus thuringiensis]MEB9418924.1 PBP1A family penicillin-binding protein [Bacillus cereus]MEC2467650.1 PBP1A family penicillin-binding protein [Bacillus cereus]MRC87425.1 PBP1A family penicillin-binding protein [Bacillus thuringiensis]